MHYLKNLLLLLLLLLCVKTGLQAQSQLPSLFGDILEQKEYLYQTVLMPGEEAEKKISSNMFIKTSYSKKSCYVGEPVLVIYQLYAGLSSQSKVIKQPAFNGCSVTEMTTDEPTYIQKVNGKIYRVFLIRKVQLTPLQEGNLFVPAATVRNDVGFTHVDNPYKIQNYTADISSKPDSIHVKALPAGKPADYSGVAGNFKISASIKSSTVPRGENDELLITLTGEGNLEAVDEPVVQWPQGLEYFEGEDSQHIDKLNFPVRGDKTFAIPFIGTQEGKKVIPPISFTFFNAALQQFQTVRTQPLSITVTHALPTQAKNDAVVTQDISNKKYLWFVPLIAFTAIAIWLISNRKNKGIKAGVQATGNYAARGQGTGLQNTNEQMINTPAKQPEAATERPDFKILLQALSEAENNATFFTNAKMLLTGALQDSLGAPAATDTNLIQLLKENNSTLALKAEEVYTLCNAFLYSPVADGGARERMIQQLAEVITATEKLYGGK